MVLIPFLPLFILSEIDDLTMIMEHPSTLNGGAREPLLPSLGSLGNNFISVQHLANFVTFVGLRTVT